MTFRICCNIDGKTLNFHSLKHGRNSCEFIITKTENYSIFLCIIIFIIGFFCITVTCTDNHNILSALILIIIYFLHKLSSYVHKETLLVIPTLGIQISETYLLHNHTATFISWNIIKDVFINEVIYRNRVIFYLTVLTEDKCSGCKQLIPLFENTQPRLACLEVMYKQIQSVICTRT